MASLHAALSTFIETEKLPESYRQTAEQWFIPLAESVLHKLSAHQGTLVLGINGCQGGGKSTLAALLVILLRELMGVRSINLSLDDFYLTHAERQELAKEVHPLLQTRGVPGTHDIGLTLKTLAALKTAGQAAIPRFNKAMDDRYSEQDWPNVAAPVDIILIEGWCLGVEAQKAEALVSSVNELEAQEDADGIWRSFVNQKLIHEYHDLFAQLDMLVMLKAPGFDRVIDWRLQQEVKLAAKTAPQSNTRIMSRDELLYFISHYERLTCHALETLAEKADVVYQLNPDQTIREKLKG